MTDTARPVHRASSLQKPTGFTLIELIAAIVILGIISAMAVATYADMRRDVRIATVQQMRGALEVAANATRSLCTTVSDCILNSPAVGGAGWPSTFIHNDRPYFLVEGWPDAGIFPALGEGAIDSHVSYSGFTIDTTTDETRFLLATATVPANCRATYRQPTVVGESPVFSVVTTGC